MSRFKVFGIVLLIGIAAVITVLATTGSESIKHESAEYSTASDKVAEPQLVDANDKALDFSAFKGKVVFVNNWASWCPPCIAEMPTIQQLKNKLKGEDIVFVMVSFDDNRDKGKSFVRKKGYDFDVYFPGAAYPYPTSSIPATFILDKTGEVVSQHVGMADYSSDELASQLKKLANE